MADLQIGRDLMAAAEKQIRDALSHGSDGAARILSAYQHLSGDAERDAFVAVLATRVTVSHLRSVGAR